MIKQKKYSVAIGAALLTGLMLASCQPEVVEVVKEVPVEKIVEVEKEVIKVVKEVEEKPLLD